MTYVAEVLRSQLVMVWCAPVFSVCSQVTFSIDKQSFKWAATFVKCLSGVFSRAEGMIMYGVAPIAWTGSDL